MGLVLLSTLAATANAGSPNIIYRTDGVMGDVDIIHGENDCTRTTGTLIVSTTEEGDVVAGFVGVSTDICGATFEDGITPLSDGQFGFDVVTKRGSALGVQTVTGSFSTSINNDHFEPLTFELAAKFTGTGRTFTQHTHDVYKEPGALFYMTFDTSQHRAAKVTGTITVNGDPITLLDPFMGAGVSGGIYPTH